ncbi:hypothetical protein D3C74_251930 [compost metagenome]
MADEIRCLLLPARRVDPSLFPRVPTWWIPAGASDASPKNQERARKMWAYDQACKGPVDGHEFTVQRGTDVPKTYASGLAPGLVYVRTDERTDDGAVVFRYSPSDSPFHGRIMEAVEEAFPPAPSLLTKD